jgi:hypothetical protein
VRIKGFVREANPAYVIHKRFVLKARGDVQEDELGKPNLDTWEPNPLPNKDCYTQK